MTCQVVNCECTSSLFSFGKLLLSEGRKIVKKLYTLIHPPRPLVCLVCSTRSNSYRRYMHSRSASRDHKHHESSSPPRKYYYSSKGPMSSLEVSLVRHQRRIREKKELHGEIIKIKPPIFYHENKRGEDVESWLLGMRKYFQLYQYSPNIEARIAIYHLKGKTSMWWD